MPPKFRTGVECPLCNGFTLNELDADDMGDICTEHRKRYGMNSEYQIKHFRRNA